MFLSVWREAFGNRVDAKPAGVIDLLRQIDGHDDRTADKRQAEFLRRIRSQGSQRMLFG